MPGFSPNWKIAYALPDDYVNAYPSETAMRQALRIDEVMASLYNKILDLEALEEIEKLPAGDHSLDDYTSTGMHLYHQMLNGNATADRKYPANYAGVLISITLEKFTYQIYWTLSSYNTIYHRTRYTTTWHPWKELGTGQSAAPEKNISEKLISEYTSSQSQYFTVSRTGNLVTVMGSVNLNTDIEGLTTLVVIPNWATPKEYRPAILSAMSLSADNSTGDPQIGVMSGTRLGVFGSFTEGQVLHFTQTYETDTPFPEEE